MKNLIKIAYTLYYPIHVIKVMYYQGFSKNMYRLGFLIKEPLSVFEHHQNYIIKKLNTKGRLRFKDITRLKTGHNVDIDDYCMGRINKFKKLGVRDRTVLYLHEIDKICPSDDTIRVFGDRIISGNGRVTALTHAGFEGEIEVMEMRA